MPKKALCRLCITTSRHFECLYDDSGQLNEVYEIVVKYFDSKILTPRNGNDTVVVCIKCWQNIQDFYSFQQMVMQSQAQLKNSKLAVRSKDKLTKSMVNATPIKEEVTPTENSMPLFDIIEIDNARTTEDTDYNMTTTKDQTNFRQISSNATTSTNLYKTCERLLPVGFEFNTANETNLETFEPICNLEITESDQNDNSTIAFIVNEFIDNDDEFLLQRSGNNKSNRSSSKRNRNGSILSVSEKQILYDQFIAKHKPELECQKCRIKFTTYGLLDIHFKEEHHGEKCYTICCKRKLISRYNLVEHLRLHLNPNIFKCHICQLNLTSKSNLKRHLLISHKDQFTKAEIEDMLEDRFLLEKRTNKLKLKCERCKTVFCSSSNLRRHIRLKHNVDQSTISEEESSNSRLDQFSTSTSNKSYPVVMHQHNSMLGQSSTILAHPIGNDISMESLWHHNQIVSETFVEEDGNKIHMPAIEIVDIKQEIFTDS